MIRRDCVRRCFGVIHQTSVQLHLFLFFTADFQFVTQTWWCWTGEASLSYSVIFSHDSDLALLHLSKHLMNCHETLTFMVPSGWSLMTLLISWLTWFWSMTMRSDFSHFGSSSVTAIILRCLADCFHVSFLQRRPWETRFHSLWIYFLCASRTCYSLEVKLN